MKLAVVMLSIWGVLILGTIAACWIGCVAMSPPPKSDAQKTLEWLEDAERREASRLYSLVCDAVKASLVSPATADFAGGWLDDPRQFAHKRADWSWAVNAYVDSENGFGATVRTRFSAKIEKGQIVALETW